MAENSENWMGVTAVGMKAGLLVVWMVDSWASLLVAWMVDYLAS